MHRETIQRANNYVDGVLANIENTMVELNKTIEQVEKNMNESISLVKGDLNDSLSLIQNNRKELK